MRPPNRPTRVLAVLCLFATPLAACAGDPGSRDGVAPIVLSEGTGSVDDRDDRTEKETGARPVDPPDPEPAGPEPDAVRRPDDDPPAPNGPADDGGGDDADDDSDDGDDADDDADGDSDDDD